MDTLFVVLVILGMLLLFVVINTSSERFDPSVRMVGWLAGPTALYGHDPIDEFAKEIEQAKHEYYLKYGVRYPE